MKPNLSVKGGVYVKNAGSKELYREARIDVLLFNAEDVIVTSDGLLDPDGSESSGNMGTWTPPEW